VNGQDPGVTISAIVAFMLLLFGLVVLVARRGKPLEIRFPGPPAKLAPVLTESGGPGGSLEAELEALGRSRDTLPAPAPGALPALRGKACQACDQPATRAVPVAGRGERVRAAGRLAIGDAVELDHHGDRLYGQPRPEVIETGAGDELCPQHELVAYRLIERFHAMQRARLNQLTGDLALEAAAFEGGGMLRELKTMGKAKGRPRGQA
jgi:hypothetical protein